jgi:hypothetical protein
MGREAAERWVRRSIQEETAVLVTVLLIRVVAVVVEQDPAVTERTEARAINGH